MMKPAPRKLSTVKVSPNYNLGDIQRINQVFVDGVHIPNVVAYDMDAGWAFGLKDGCWQPKVFGTVEVTVKA